MALDSVDVAGVVIIAAIAGIIGAAAFLIESEPPCGLTVIDGVRCIVCETQTTSTGVSSSGSAVTVFGPTVRSVSCDWAADGGSR